MSDSHGDFERLERALEIFGKWEDAGMQPAAGELLAAHEDLREVLEPLLENAMGDVSEPDGEGDGPPRGPGQLPREIGGFRIEYELGRGAMGVVYAARQVALDRPVALKVLADNGTIEPRAVARFRRESALLASLDHPSLVEILTVGRDAGCEFFAMELVDGVPLHRVLLELGGDPREQLDGTHLGSTVATLFQKSPSAARSRSSSQAASASESGWHRGYSESVAGIIRQIADALAHAHDAGVLHRDVKPSNILLRQDGRAVLTDFGLAREVGRPSLTQSGEFAGTPYYAAPEQVLGRATDLDGRVDVFALGVVLYELLTLRRPFEGATNHEVAQAILTTEPTDPSTIQRRLPADLAAITLRALEKDPRRRYQTAREFADDLDAFLGHRPVRARKAGPLRRLQRYVRREPWQATLVLLLMLAVPALAFLGGYLQARAPLVAAGEAELQGQKVDALLDRFSMQMELGDATAGQLLDECLAIDPGHADTVGLVVWWRCDKGDGMTLAELDELLAKAELGDDARLRLRVPVLFKLGKSDEARKLQQSLPAPTTALGAFYSGLAELANGHRTQRDEHFHAAAEQFELALLLAPRRRPIYLNKLAHALGHAGDDERRAQVADALDRAWPDSAPQQYWSYFAEKDSNRARARKRLQRAIALRSDMATLHYNLGTSLQKSGLHREALAPLQRALEMAPKYAPAHVNESKSLYRTGDTEGALAAIERAIAIEPNNTMYRANRAQYLLALGKVDDALAAHEEVLEIDPGQAISLSGVAYIKYTREGAEACRAFCADQVENGHGAEQIRRYLVMSLTKLQRYDEAVAAADEAIARYPKAPWLHLRRAYAIKHKDRAGASRAGRTPARESRDRRPAREPR